jgi:SOS response regulatory protein OraA/RecX
MACGNGYNNPMISHAHKNASTQGKKPNLRQNPRYVAQDILSRRDHSEAEVYLKMKRKNFSSHQINETIQWLKTKHLINDATFAQKYIQSTLEFKSVGPLWFKQKLHQKKNRFLIHRIRSRKNLFRLA